MNSTLFGKSHGARSSVRPSHRAVKSSGLKSALLTPRLFVLLSFLSLAACQKKETASSAPTLPLATDIDLGHGYVRRDGAIHYIGGGTTGTGANATRIDMPSPAILKKLVKSQYGPFKTAEGLDAASFEALSTTYTRDKNHVYYKIDDIEQFIIIQLPEADPASFHLSADGIVRDKNHVWYGDRILAGIDPTTAEMVRQDFTVIKDKDSVHYQYTQIPGADPASFKHIGSGYYADSKRVYWGATPIPDADPANFQVMGDSFIAKDSSRIYRSGVPLLGYDVASFELILHNEAGFQIFSDKNGIHIDNMTFPRSKPGKAEIIDNLTVKVGDLVHTVSTYQYTPVTVFQEDGKLIAEAPCYEPESQKTLGMITAEVTEEGLKDIRIVPLPGHSWTPTPPEWQLRAFTRSDLVDRMIKSGKLLKPSQHP